MKTLFLFACASIASAQLTGTISIPMGVGSSTPSLVGTFTFTLDASAVPDGKYCLNVVNGVIAELTACGSSALSLASLINSQLASLTNSQVAMLTD
jgi:hypothetical protein